MTHGSLFSGIGGFDLAASWMGWENVFHCEIAPFCQKVLKYHFPNSILYENIKTTDFTKYRGTIDILTGGFPCQPFSLAGKRKGTEDDRHLWPEMLRAIREIKPKWIVGENVFGIVNWDGGLVFQQVQTDLETEGYEVQAFILPAASVNAPHKRERVWFVAKNSYKLGYSDREIKTGFRGSREFISTGSKRIINTEITPNTNLYGCERIDSEYEVNPNERGFNALNDIEPVDVTDSSNEGLERSARAILSERGKRFAGENNEFTPNPNSRRQSGKKYRKTESGFITETSSADYWENFPTQSPLCSRDDGISNRLDGITFPKWRNESIKAYGNAIVPQVAFQIFKAIQEYENTF